MIKKYSIIWGLLSVVSLLSACDTKVDNAPVNPEKVSEAESTANISVDTDTVDNLAKEPTDTMNDSDNPEDLVDEEQKY